MLFNLEFILFERFPSYLFPFLQLPIFLFPFFLSKFFAVAFFKQQFTEPVSLRADFCRHFIIFFAFQRTLFFITLYAFRTYYLKVSSNPPTKIESSGNEYS